MASLPCPERRCFLQMYCCFLVVLVVTAVEVVVVVVVVVIVVVVVVVVAAVVAVVAVIAVVAIILLYGIYISHRVHVWFLYLPLPQKLKHSHGSVMGMLWTYNSPRIGWTFRFFWDLKAPWTGEKTSFPTCKIWCQTCCVEVTVFSRLDKLRCSENLKAKEMQGPKYFKFEDEPNLERNDSRYSRKHPQKLTKEY